MPRHAIHLGTAWEPPMAGESAWVRRFGRPTGVDAGDRVLLACESVVAADAWRLATLNGRPLAWHESAPGTLECDVTGLVDDRNVLVLPVAAAAGANADVNAGAGRAPLPRDCGRPSLVIVSD